MVYENYYKNLKLFFTKIDHPSSKKTRVNEILKKNKPNCKDLGLNPLCHCGYIYNIMYGNYFDGNEYKCIIII